MISLEFSGSPPADRMLRAGVEAERQLAFYLDRAFREPAYDFRIFHGLRILRHGDVAQIDHLVLHRFGFVLVESKSIVDSVSINEHGEFTRWFRKQPRGMPSPIAQARRQASVLQLLLDDQKQHLRRRVGIGPLKWQIGFPDQRFTVIAAISDKGRIRCDGERPPELMKAEAVVDAIQKRVDYQQSLAGASGLVRAAVADLTNREKAREWDENYLRPFTDEEIDAITEFLLASHQPRERSSNTAEAQATEHAVASPDGGANAPAPAEAATAVRSTPARNLKRWTAEEEERLREAFAAGRSPADLADSFGRTVKALRLRAVKLGLIAEPKEW